MGLDPSWPGEVEAFWAPREANVKLTPLSVKFPRPDILGVRVSSRADTSLYLPRGDIPSETILVRMTPNTLSMTP